MNSLLNEEYEDLVYIIFDTKTSHESIERKVYCRFFYLFNKRTVYNYMLSVVT